MSFHSGVMDRWDIFEDDRWLDGEKTIATANQVGLYEKFTYYLILSDNRLKDFDSGDLILTNHRIVFKGSQKLVLSLSLVTQFQQTVRFAFD